MKKSIIAGLLCLISLTGLFAFANNQKIENANSENGDCKYGQCQFIKKNLEQCKHCVSKQYDTYCSQHK